MNSKHLIARLLLSATLVAQAASCRSAQGAGKGAPDASARVVPVVAAVASRRDVPIVLEGLGSVAGFYTATVRSQVDGVLLSVPFQEGQTVKKGQLLAQIDPRPYDIALHQAQGALIKDAAALKGAQADLQRYKELVAQKLVPQQQVDDQDAVVGQDEGAVAVDKANIEAAQLNIAYARITAPIDGVTGVRQVDPGNLIHATDTTGIVILTQLDPISVYITLPEDNLPELALQLEKGPLPVDSFSRDGGTKFGTGKLVVIDNQINQTTATLKLKAVFPNARHQMWPNQFVKARIQLETLKNVMTVPSPAVQRGPDGTFCYVVRPEDSTVELRKVEVSQTQGDLAILKDAVSDKDKIVSGVKDGEQVVTDGQAQLRDKAKVKAHVVGAPPVLAQDAPAETPAHGAHKRDGNPEKRE